MAAPKIDCHKNYARALRLLRENHESEACLAFARIAGWNFAMEESPLMSVAMWNVYLPNNLMVNYDAFVDKGETPEHLTKSQMKEIQMLEEVPTDPHADGFQPFYTWTLSNPIQSKVFIQRQQTYAKARAEYFEKYVESRKRMRPQRYWGD